MSWKRYCAAAVAAMMLMAAPAQAISIAPTYGEERAVDIAAENGLIPESLQNRYAGYMTRLEMCQIALQVLRTGGQRGGPTDIEAQPFTDTTDAAVAKMVGFGVIDKAEDGLFHPTQKMTRQELALFFYRLSSCNALNAPYATQLTPGTWTGELSSDGELLDAVSFCVNTGVLPLKEDGSFGATDPVGFSEAIAATGRLYDNALGTPLNMTASGYEMLYANNPEELKNSTFENRHGGRRGIYTAKADMYNGQILDTEYYHWNYTGMTLVTGVAITNHADTEGSFTVLRSGTATGTSTLDTTEQCNIAYLASEPLQTQTVAAGETVFAVRSDYEKSLMINSRSRIQAHSPDLEVTIFVLYDRTAGPSFIPKLPRATDDSKGRTSALFPMSERNVAIDGTKMQNFTLCGNSTKTWNINTGEFPYNANSAIGGIHGNGSKERAHFLNGNYGTVYNIEFRDAVGKTLSVRPNDPTVTTGRYLLYTEKDGWQIIEPTKEAPFTMELTGKLETVKFLLLGGNTGNVGFNIA